MTDTPSKTKTTRRPDCVTEVRMGNTGLIVSDVSASGVGRGNNLLNTVKAY